MDTGDGRMLAIAWRNLWRNRRRTWITIAAVAANTAVLIVTIAHIRGIYRHTVSNAVNIVTGEVQIHHPDYLAARSIYDTVSDPAAVADSLARAGIGTAARSYGYGLAACTNKSSGARFWGIDPASERKAFDLWRHVDQGRFLEGNARGGVVLGRKLAHALQATVGSEIVAVVQAADGSLGNELFTVTGVLKSAGEDVDASAAILHRDDFNGLFAAGGLVHEIAANTRGALPLAEVTAAGRRAAPGAEVKTWRELMPALNDMLNMFQVSLWIFQVVFFLAAGLGVLNTMLMATFERFREFGILKALGASPGHVVRQVAAEALVMGLAATALGVVLGLAGALYLQIHGLDTRMFVSGDLSVAGVAFDPVWKARITLQGVVEPVVAMWVVCILASLYPAAIAARLDPVKAIHHV